MPHGLNDTHKYKTDCILIECERRRREQIFSWNPFIVYENLENKTLGTNENLNDRHASSNEQVGSVKLTQSHRRPNPCNGI